MVLKKRKLQKEEVKSKVNTRTKKKIKEETGYWTKPHNFCSNDGYVSIVSIEQNVIIKFIIRKAYIFAFRMALLLV